MKFSKAILCALAAESAAAFAPSRTSASTPAAVLSAAATLETDAPTPTPAVPKSLEKELNSLEEEIERQKSAQAQAQASSQREVEEKAQVVAASSSAAEKAAADRRGRIQPGRYDDKDNSIAVPFLKRPAALDGSLAGDVGFDPLGLSEQYNLYDMAEAELRHARLAMLAVVGWPLSELLGPDWMLQGQNNLAPSVLNGFNPLTFLTTAAIFAGFGFFEYKTSLRRVDDKTLGRKHYEDMADVWKYGVPGDYNFDPLGLYSMFGDDALGRKAIREMEIAHGRAAMLGITGFAAWEALTGHPVVENSMFFHPNLALPALAAAYLSFGFFFEVENDDRYLLQVKMSSEGEMRMERMKNGLSRAAEDNQDTVEGAKKLGAALLEGAKELPAKYDQFVEDYTKSKMQYTDKA